MSIENEKRISMKESFEEPKVEIVALDANDVIVTSSSCTNPNQTKEIKPN